MAETLVDLAYRGVSLARRVKLVQVRPGAGQLEMPAPMPVGSTIRMVCDDGTAFDAAVTRVTEQVTGSSAVAGMTVAPALDSDAARAWWTQRVELGGDAGATDRVPVIEVAAEATAPVTMPEAAADTDVAGAAVAAALVAASRASPATRPPPAVLVEDDHSRRTVVMDTAMAVALAEAAEAGDIDATPVDMPAAPGGRIEDDGKRTEMMPSVDLAALGLEPSASGRLPVVATPVDDEASEPQDGEPGSDDKPAERPSTPGKRRRKKR